MDRHERSLPRTVKLVDGFWGSEEDETLEADQILVLYKVERLNVIMALDAFRQEIFFPRNSNFKVYLLPPECKIYSTVQKLITDQTPPFFLVLEDIPSAGIESGSKINILSNGGSVSNHLKCQVIKNGKSKEVLLYSHFKGKFLPLLEATEYSLDEVVTQKHLPVSVRFVSGSISANDRVIAPSLTNLGNICLKDEAEVSMVFAASFDLTLSLYVFPKTLEVNVSCGFKASAETSRKVKECRKILQTGVTSLEELDDFVASSFYYAASPVRKFSLQSPQEPALPVLPPRSRIGECQQMTEVKLYTNVVDLTQHDLVPEGYDKQAGVAVPSVIVYDDRESGSQEDIPPPLPPKYGEKTRSEFVSLGVTPPVLPPKHKSDCETHDSDLAYLVVDLRTWKRDEDEHEGDTSFLLELTGEPDEGERVDKKPPERDKSNFGTCEKVNVEQDDVRNVYQEVTFQPVGMEDYLIPAEQKQSGHKMNWEDADDDYLIPEEARGNAFEQNDARNAYLEVIHQPDRTEELKREGHMADWEKANDDYWKSAKDDVIKHGDARNVNLELIHEPDDVYLVSREEEEGKKHQMDWEKAEDDDYANVLDGGSLTYPHLLRKSMENTEVQHVAEENDSSDDEPYEEIFVPLESLESSAREFRLESTTGKQKKEGMKKPSTMSSSNNNDSSKTTGTSGKEEVAAAPSIDNNNIWISTRREEDCMDFNDIEQFFKLRKQLNDLSVRAKDLEQVCTKEEPMERRRLPKKTDNTTPWFSSDRSHDLDNDSEEAMKESLAKKKTDAVPERAKPAHQKCQVRKHYGPEHVCNDGNGDIYEECIDRKFVSHKTSHKNNLVFFYGNDSKYKEKSGT